MIISAIAAITRNWVIGKDNDIPWHLPKDLKWFMQTTSNHHVLMGRKNYQSLGKALPNRTNMVISANTNLSIDDAIIFHEIPQAIEHARQSGETELFIIGGQTIYEQTQLQWDKVYLTHIDTELEGDTFFPPIDWSDWRIDFAERHLSDDRHAYDYEFRIYTPLPKKSRD